MCDFCVTLRGPAGERFKLGEVIAALHELAGRIGGLGRLGLELVQWVSGERAWQACPGRPHVCWHE